MKTTALRQLIKESIQEYIREVETSGNIAAQEAKIRACEEAIALREKKANMEGLDEAYHDMMDQSKLNELKKEIKELQKYKSKAERLLEKMKSKTEKKDKEEETEEGRAIINQEGTVDEVTIDEMDPESGPQLEEDSLNESFLHMQKLAGLITETQYKKKMQMLNEIEIKVGSIYVYEHPKAGPVKVKALGKSEWGDEYFTIEALEDKGEVRKGNQYNAEIEKLTVTESEYKKKRQELNEVKINEEKDINEFGKNLMDKLKKSGFDAKFVDNEPKKIELEKIVKEDPKKLAVVYFDKAINYVSITTNKDNQDEALKIADSSKMFLPDGYTISKQGGYFVQIQPKL